MSPRSIMLCVAQNSHCLQITSNHISFSNLGEYHIEGPVPGSKIPPSRPIFIKQIMTTNNQVFKEHGNDIKYNLNTLKYIIQQSLK
jgi:hypothetical protein